MTIQIREEWTDFKDRNGNLKYRASPTDYQMWKNDGDVTWLCRLKKDSGTDVNDFETNHKPTADARAHIYESRTPEGVPLFTSIKNFSDNSINRVSCDYGDQRTWWKYSTQATGETMSDASNITYSFPHTNVVDTYYISDRDLLPAGYEWKIYKNGVLQTEGTSADYTIDHPNGTVVFNASNQNSDVVTADYYWVDTTHTDISRYDLTVDSGKFFLLDYIEIQVSKGATINDKLRFELILNNATTGNTDYVAGSTEFINAKDFLNKSNGGFTIEPFGELTVPINILPWNYLTGYKIFPIGTVCDPFKNEFNILRCRLVNNEPMTNCEVSTATFYCYERQL